MPDGSSTPENITPIREGIDITPTTLLKPSKPEGWWSKLLHKKGFQRTAAGVTAATAIGGAAGIEIAQHNSSSAEPTPVIRTVSEPPTYPNLHSATLRVDLAPTPISPEAQKRIQDSQPEKLMKPGEIILIETDPEEYRINFKDANIHIAPAVSNMPGESNKINFDDIAFLDGYDKHEFGNSGMVAYPRIVSGGADGPFLTFTAELKNGKKELAYISNSPEVPDTIVSRPPNAGTNLTEYRIPDPNTSSNTAIPTPQLPLTVIKPLAK